MTSATATPPRAVLAHLYAQMVLIREFETEAERQYKAARGGGYCHVASGQEAATGGTVHALEPDGVDAEAVDLRSLRPPDLETVADSVSKTNYAVCIEEGWPSCAYRSPTPRTCRPPRCRPRIASRAVLATLNLA